jgi:uncharacterized membrane protein
LFIEDFIQKEELNMKFGSGGYQPNDELFRNIILVVLSAIVCIFYIFKIAFSTQEPEMHDWLILSGVTIALGYMVFRLHMDESGSL